MKPSLSSGGKGGKIIFVSGVAFGTVMAIIGYFASLNNHYVITPP